MQAVTVPKVGTKRKEWEVGGGNPHPPQGTTFSSPSPYIFPLTTPPRFLPAAREFVGSLLADLARNKTFADLLQAGPRAMSDSADRSKVVPMAPHLVMAQMQSSTTMMLAVPRVAQQWLDILTDILTAVELWVAVQSPHLGRWTPLQLQMTWSFAHTIDKAILALQADDSDREFCEGIVRSAFTLAFQEHPADMAPPKVAFPPFQCRWFAQFSRHLAHAWLSNAAADRLMLITLLARHPGAVTPQSGPSMASANAPSFLPMPISATLNASAVARRWDLEQFAQLHARLPTLVSLHSRLIGWSRAPKASDLSAVPAVVSSLVLPPQPLYLDCASLASRHRNTSTGTAALPLWNVSTQVATSRTAGGKTMASTDESAVASAIDESSVFCDAVTHVLLRRCMEVTEGLVLPDARSFVDAFILNCVGAAQNRTRLAVLLRAYALSFKIRDHLPLLRSLSHLDQPSTQPLEVPLPRASAWGFDLHLASPQLGLAEVTPTCQGLMERIIIGVAQVWYIPGVSCTMATRPFTCISASLCDMGQAFGDTHVWTIDDDLILSVVEHAAQSVDAAAVEGEGVESFHPLLARLLNYILTCIAIHSQQGFTSADAYFAFRTKYAWMLPISLPWSPSLRSQLPDINWLAKCYVSVGRLHQVWDHMGTCVDLLRNENSKSSVWWADFEHAVQMLVNV
jgi:hypothetical protein